MDFDVLKEYNGRGKCHEIQLDYFLTAPSDYNLMKDLESYSSKIEWIAYKEPVEALGPFQYLSWMLYKIGLLYFFKITKPYEGKPMYLNLILWSFIKTKYLIIIF